MVFTRGADRRYGRPEVYGDGDVVRVAIFPDLQIVLATVFAE
jgi:hypothetical protein